ncbi:MAG: hypothetical protein P1P84_22515 [Deferrisomatales bacterium]|nr:hypothetical protein [Deferrisomatales bacterium]
MSLLFTQDWDVIQGQEDAYEQFVTDRFIPQCDRLGLSSVGGFYVQVGVGPKIISIKSAPSLADLSKAMGSREFRELKLGLRRYVINYSSKILEPTLATAGETYAIQKGVWKYNIYFDVRPEMRSEFSRFMETTYLPTLRAVDYLQVTECWNVLIGGFSEMIVELTFQDPVDIGRMFDHSGFREITYHLDRDLVRNYKSRILRTTERFDEPKWFRL